MDRNYLNDKLYYIRENVRKENAQTMLKALDDIYLCKPITLLYFNVKAKVLCEIEEYEEAIEILKFKMNLNLLEEEYIETCKLFQRAYSQINEYQFCEKFKYLENLIRNKLDNRGFEIDVISEIEKARRILEENFLENQNHCLAELSEIYWKSWFVVETLVMEQLIVAQKKLDLKERLFIKTLLETEVNCNFFIEQLQCERRVFILVSNEQNLYRIKVLAKALKLLNKQVYMFMPAISENVESSVNIEETVQISLDNIQVDEQEIIRIIPIQLMVNNVIKGDNIALLLEKVMENNNDDFAMLIGDESLFNSLSKNKYSKKRVQRLSEVKAEAFADNLQFGYFGSYISYISQLYSVDVKREIEKPSEYKFSIVIPVRNSADSLKFTLKTCLEQRNMSEEDYEIIVSDNSAEDYTEIEALIKELDTPKIKYLRTPRKLTLGRSFEYAFIHSKGEFILSIGSDDGILPWGLDILEQVLREFPKDDIFQWDRGFFVWPNNDKIQQQAGQFVIPRSYNKDICITRYNCLEKIHSILTFPDRMYDLPMLYINSGFRRKYIKRLFEETGRLWDGGSQDVYIGIVNLFMYDTIPYINSPITIAGMSANSIGIDGNNGQSRNYDYVKKSEEYFSYYGNIVPYGEEKNCTCISLDKSLLYSSFFRVFTIYKTESKDRLDNVLDLKKVFTIIANLLNYSNIKFDYDIQSLRCSAYNNSNEFGLWFDNEILGIIREPKCVENINEKRYEEGFTLNGGLQLDSRKFNVYDIYEAVKLFGNICNL